MSTEPNNHIHNRKPVADPKVQPLNPLAYHPPLVDEACAARVNAAMLDAASDASTQRPQLTFRLFPRLAWSAIAALLLIALGVFIFTRGQHIRHEGQYVWIDGKPYIAAVNPSTQET